jgi:hypothetical protein
MKGDCRYYDKKYRRDIFKDLQELGGRELLVIRLQSGCLKKEYATIEKGEVYFGGKPLPKELIGGYYFGEAR